MVVAPDCIIAASAARGSPPRSALSAGTGKLQVQRTVAVVGVPDGGPVTVHGVGDRPGRRGTYDSIEVIKLVPVPVFLANDIVRSAGRQRYVRPDRAIGELAWSATAHEHACLAARHVLSGGRIHYLQRVDLCITGRAQAPEASDL